MDHLTCFNRRGLLSKCVLHRVEGCNCAVHSEHPPDTFLNQVYPAVDGVVIKGQYSIEGVCGIQPTKECLLRGTTVDHTALIRPIGLWRLHREGKA